MMDIISELYYHNLVHVIESILFYSGHESVVNCLCTCKSWNHIITSVGSFDSLIRRYYRRRPYFRRLCSANNWWKHIPVVSGRTTPTETFLSSIIFYRMTDVKEMIRNTKISKYYRVFTGGMVNIMILHNHRIICGMFDGEIKLWDLQSIKIGKAYKRLSGHKAKVTGLSAHDSMLVSVSEDKSMRLWNLGSCVVLRVIRNYATGVSDVELSARTIITCRVTSEDQYQILLWSIYSIDEIKKVDMLSYSDDDDFWNYCIQKDKFVILLGDEILVYNGENGSKFALTNRVSKKVSSMSIMSIYENLLVYNDGPEIIFYDCRDDIKIRQITFSHLNIKDDSIISEICLNDYMCLIGTAEREIAYLHLDGSDFRILPSEDVGSALIMNSYANIKILDNFIAFIGQFGDVVCIANLKSENNELELEESLC